MGYGNKYFSRTVPLRSSLGRYAGDGVIEDNYSDESMSYTTEEHIRYAQSGVHSGNYCQVHPEDGTISSVAVLDKTRQLIRLEEYKFNGETKRWEQISSIKW